MFKLLILKDITFAPPDFAKHLGKTIFKQDETFEVTELKVDPEVSDRVWVTLRVRADIKFPFNSDTIQIDYQPKKKESKDNV
jgi:hypothetical protein